VVRDRDCVGFLQWALPRLGFRWAGFRRVRRQVCRRIERRLRKLDLPDVGAYRELLIDDPEEWERLAPLCRVTISRFFRDRELFRDLAVEVLPTLARCFLPGGGGELSVWSAGCGAGEEPYSMSMLVHREAALAALQLRILGTDLDRYQLERARAAIYPGSSLRDLPTEWRRAAFALAGEDQWRLASPYREGVELAIQDLRRQAPAERFHLVLCRNLALTYFAEPLQRRTLERIRGRLRPGGALIVGGHETLPASSPGFELWRRSVWRAVL
jgi:chemotaxis protein methyltransferase CheR